jgi:hypothetical protein
MLEFCLYTAISIQGCMEKGEMSPEGEWSPVASLLEKLHQNSYSLLAKRT